MFVDRCKIYLLTSLNQSSALFSFKDETNQKSSNRAFHAIKLSFDPFDTICEIYLMVFKRDYFTPFRYLLYC